MKRRLDVIRNGDAFTTRTVVGSTNESSLEGGTITWTGSLRVPVDLQNPVVAAYARARETFGTVMNFGIPEIEIGAARWDGQQVSASGYATSLPVSFQGTLILGETGAPSRLDLKRTSLGGILYFEIHYSSPHLTVRGSETAHLPARFEVYEFANRKDKNVPVQEVSIEKLATASADHVRLEVDRLTLLAAQMNNQFLMQDRTLYARLRDGTLIPDQRLNQPLPFRISYSFGRLLYWSVTGALAIGFLLFLGRGAWKQTKHITLKKTESR